MDVQYYILLYIDISRALDLTGARIPMAAERMAVLDNTVAPATPLPACGVNIRRRGEK